MSAPGSDPVFGGSVVFRRFFAAGWAVFALLIAAQRFVLAPIDGAEMGVGRVGRVWVGVANSSARLAQL